MKNISLFAASVLTALTVTACKPNTPTPPPIPTEPTVDLSSKETVAEGVVQALKTVNMGILRMYVHPEKGVRFTPYTHVNTETDVVVPANEIAPLITSPTRNWGVQEGSGEPINLPYQLYHNRYVYNHDYAEAPKVYWNTPFDRGTIIDNAAEAYPAADIVEYHFPEFDPQYEGMDWSSLRLVLEKSGDKYYLVGIIHDEWTP